jgi:hypothetical protein
MPADDADLIEQRKKEFDAETLKKALETIRRQQERIRELEANQASVMATQAALNSMTRTLDLQIQANQTLDKLASLLKASQQPKTTPPPFTFGRPSLPPASQLTCDMCKRPIADPGQETDWDSVLGKHVTTVVNRCDACIRGRPRAF